jgi:hypothetical protein
MHFVNVAAHGPGPSLNLPDIRVGGQSEHMGFAPAGLAPEQPV